MKRIVRHIEEVSYASSIHPEITTRREQDAQLIEWADAGPVAWKIVLGNKSAAFGKGSEPANRTPIDLLAKLHGALEYPVREHENAETIARFWRWRAGFTITHYGDKGFRGDLFTQWDGAYNRCCTHLDYTPGTLEEVIDRFIGWCNTFPSPYETHEVRIKEKTVRRIKP